MRLVHKNLRHTGYAIFKDKNGVEEIVPMFTNDLLEESTFLENKYGKDVVGVYGARILMEDLLEGIKRFKKTHGIIPQNLVEELRTGFVSNRFLTQTYPKYYYK